MTAADLTAIFPLLILGAATVVAMLLIAVRRSHDLVVSAAVVGLALALGSIRWAQQAGPVDVTPLVRVDGYVLFFVGLVVAAALATTFFAYGYLAERGGQREEFYVLLLAATLGAAFLVSARHFASFFLGLETLSVSLYGLIAYLREEPRGIEAGLKYLILAAASSAYLLLGMGLLYAETGSMDLGDLAQVLAHAQSGGVLALSGIGLMLVGIGFKLALVPFHLWTPDVYQGAPAPVTAYVATVSKGAVVALLLRYLGDLPGDRSSALYLVAVAIALASMLIGNLLALMQQNVKRLLAYSSIAHLGYLLVAFLAGGELAVEAVTFYLVAYVATTIAAFGVVTVLSPADREAESIEDYRALFWRRPWMAAVFTAALLSLAGIPLTAGFVAKFFVITAGVDAAIWTLVLALVANSVVALFYYLRVVVAMLRRPAEAPGEGGSLVRVPFAAGVMLALTLLVLVWLGVYPASLQEIVRGMVAASL